MLWVIWKEKKCRLSISDLFVTLESGENLHKYSVICKRSNPTWKNYMNFQSSKLKLHFSEKMKLISSILLLNAVNCMYFYLEPGTKKCIKECFTKSLQMIREIIWSSSMIWMFSFCPFVCIRFCEICQRKKFIRMSLLLVNMK